MRAEHGLCHQLAVTAYMDLHPWAGPMTPTHTPQHEFAALLQNACNLDNAHKALQHRSSVAQRQHGEYPALLHIGHAPPHGTVTPLGTFLAAALLAAGAARQRHTAMEAAHAAVVGACSALLLLMYRRGTGRRGHCWGLQDRIQR